MQAQKSALGLLTLVLASLHVAMASSSTDEVVIGDIDDLSGPYSDNNGPGSIESIKLAIADFGGSVLGRKIVLLTADHQNKPDLGASKAREWADEKRLNLLFGGANTGVAIAMSKVAAEKKVPMIVTGAAGASLTNEDCTPYTVHYAYDTIALANGTATAVVENGGKSWFYLVADYAFGTQLQNAASRVVEARGGKNVGAVRVPLGAPDYSAFLLQAQNSKAEVLGLAFSGTDLVNSLRAATEFGVTRTMKPVALLAFINDIHALGLQAAQGLYLTTAWYWDLNTDTRAFTARYISKVQKPPTMTQAAQYSATLTYLKAVKAAQSVDADKVMTELRRADINDMFTHHGYIRADGLMVHSMYVMQVKAPQQSKYPWDYFKLVKTMRGEDAFGAITGRCPLAR